MPIVTLSKSMSSAALGAWSGLACAVVALACGPRCTGATWRCAAGDADRCGRELIFLGITCARLRACDYMPRRLHDVSLLRRMPQAVRLQVHASESTLSRLVAGSSKSRRTGIIYTQTPMNQLRFRTRLVLILSLFAIIPALVLTLLWGGTISTALPFVTGRPAWDSVAASGEKAIAAARQAPLTASQRRAIDAHERELRTSVEQARRYSFLAVRTVR